MKRLGLSGNMLKIIAALCMVIDHTGLFLLPSYSFLRVIGRISFPIFAFLIAEGCQHTKNKARYLFVMLLFAFVCQIPAFYISASLGLNIFFTFSFAILIIYCSEFFAVALQNKDWSDILISTVSLFFVSALVFIVDRYFTIDYGFFGCLLPVFATAIPYSKDLLRKTMRILLFAVGLFLLIICSENPQQAFCCLCLIPLIFYNGKRGKYNLKYFFYIFYPLHLIIIYGILLYK